MARSLWCLAVVLALATALSPPLQAARDLTVPPPTSSNLEMVVLEVDGCIYCNVFRKQMQPNYEASKQGRAVPLRFIDINDHEKLAKLGLTQPVGIVPTFVILENNSEIGRIPGYMGHHDFFRAIDHILAGRIDF